MSRHTSEPREMTECVLRIQDGWTGRVSEVVAILVAEGVDVTRFAADRRDVAGVVESSRVRHLLRLPCVLDVVEGAKYVVGGKAVRTMRPVAAYHGSAGLLELTAESAFLEEMAQDDQGDAHTRRDLQPYGMAHRAARPCLGFARHRLFGHACIILTLLMGATACISWFQGSYLRAFVAFGAFLITGTATEALASQPR